MLRLLLLFLLFLLLLECGIFPVISELCFSTPESTEDEYDTTMGKKPGKVRPISLLIYLESQKVEYTRPTCRLLYCLLLVIIIMFVIIIIYHYIVCYFLLSCKAGGGWQGDGDVTDGGPHVS